MDAAPLGRDALARERPVRVADHLLERAADDREMLVCERDDARPPELAPQVGREQAVRREDAGIGRHDHVPDPEPFREPQGVQRSATAECDQGE